MKLNPLERKLMNKKVKEGIPINIVAWFFGVSRKTVWYHKSETQNSNFRDLPRKLKPSKVTLEVEIMILYLRITFSWGTAKIQQGLMNLPDFYYEEMEVVVKNLSLSRTSINNVLKKHKINGYMKKRSKAWKFFRAKKPNELWQIDYKEFKLNGRKYWLLVVIDDYSRYIVALKLFDHCPTTRETTSVLQKLKVKPEKILADNGAQFKEQWKQWNKKNGIEAIFAHPYYPQDKGKVERTIRTLCEEFINLLSKFPRWIGNLMKWKNWFNNKRYHRGIKGYPGRLYVTL